MTYSSQAQPQLQKSGIRTWRHGEFPMPAWLENHMIGDVEPNGTLALSTQLGRARVHLGNIVIERHGELWVRGPEEASEFVSGLLAVSDNTITTVGPGKSRQYGTASLSKVRSKTEGKNGKGAYPAPVGSPPSIEWIQVDRLSVDASYQRSIDNAASKRLIISIGAKFDWRLCTPLVVSRRADDALVIIDGQHRWTAAVTRGDISHLPCCIFRYGSTKEEAEMFILANRARRAISRLDDYFAALTAMDEDALEIDQLVSDAGLSISRSMSSTAWKPGEITFTSSIAAAIRRYGPAVTSAVLTNIAVAFPGQKLTHGGAIFGGLIRIMGFPPAGFDPDRLVAALQTRTVEDWGLSAIGLNGGDQRAVAMQNAIWATYLAPSSELNEPEQ